MRKARILSAFVMLWLAILSCSFPGPAQGGPIPPAESPAPDQPGGAPPSGGVQPAGEPVLSLQPGSGYLFASSQVVHGADARDVWWNGATLVPGQKIASLGPVADLSSIDQIKPSLITEIQIQPVPGEGYVMPTTDGKYVLLRMLSLGAQGEINVEWLYPFAGVVLP